jgi:N-acetylneuraminate synthase
LRYQSIINKSPFFIAEISANHNGSLYKAKKLIALAKRYGADAVKFQTYTPDTITIKSIKKDFIISNRLWRGNTLWDFYNKANTI